MAKNKPTKTVKKTPCGNQPRSRLMKAYESVIGVVAFGLYCNKGFASFAPVDSYPKSVKLLGLWRSKFEDCRRYLIGTGITTEVSDCFFCPCQRI